MKTKNLLLAVITIAFIGCDKYLVPDNFPKEDFYSYAPYELGDTVRFVAESTNDTMTYIVSYTEEYYLIGNRKCKCGKEDVYEYVSLSKQGSTDDEDIKFKASCRDRARFVVELWSDGSAPVDAKFMVDYSDEDIWAESYDETKIFKSFADELTLTQNDNPAALIKKGQGIVWFVDASGTTWNVCK